VLLAQQQTAQQPVQPPVLSPLLSPLPLPTSGLPAEQEQGPEPVWSSVQHWVKRSEPALPRELARQSEPEPVPELALPA
jgi:hypothetical protein